MTEFYDITTDLKNALINSPFVNTVTTGGLEDVDLNKKTIFPLSHIIINSAVPRSQTVSFNISVIAMDIVDESKETTTNIFVGNDNEQDVLNTQFQVLNRLYKEMTTGQLFSDLIQIIGDPTCEPFTDRFENKLAGWTMTFDVEIPNEMTICGDSIPSSCADAFIENSDGSYSAFVASGDELILPDTEIILKDTNGNIISTTNFPSVYSNDLTAPDAIIQINNRTFGTAKSNETKNFSFTTAKLMATGQTTSYATGDDGNLQRGRNFFTLLENNPFANTNRFTALDGSQTYTNNIVLDWSTWDGQTVLGWYRIPQGTAITWANALTSASSFSIIGYSGWRLPNVNELMSIGWFGLVDMYNYAPFNIITKILWTSTTALANTLNAYRTPNTGFMTNGSKTSTNSTQSYIPCRNFTNAELGI